MKSSIHQKINEQYSSSAGSLFYRYVMGDGSDHIHYGLYKEQNTRMLEAVQASTQRILDIAQGQLDSEVKNIIDLGAGAGGATKCLLEWTKANICSVDIGSASLNTLDKWAKQQNLEHRLKTIHNSFQELPKNLEKQFDIVWSQDALCHSTNRLDVFKEAKRVLNPKGVFVFSDIFLAENLPKEKAEAFTKVNVIQNLSTIQEYSQTLKLAGFSEVKFEDWSSHFPMNFKRMHQQIEKYHQEMLEQGVPKGLIEGFKKALENRLTWEVGEVLCWGVFSCKI